MDEEKEVVEEVTEEATDEPAEETAEEVTEEKAEPETNPVEERLTAMEEKLDQLVILCRNLMQRDIPPAVVSDDAKPERMFL